MFLVICLTEILILRAYTIYFLKHYYVIISITIFNKKMVEYQISKLCLEHEGKIYFCFKKEFFPLDSHDAKISNDIYDDKQYI